MNILTRIWYELEKPIRRKTAKNRIKKIGQELGVLGKKDELWFGKYRGLTIKDVLDTNPSYICWLIDNTQLTFTKAVQVKARKGRAEQDAKRAYNHGRYIADYDVENDMDWGGEFDGGGNMGMWQ